MLVRRHGILHYITIIKTRHGQKEFINYHDIFMPKIWSYHINLGKFNICGFHLTRLLSLSINRPYPVSILLFADIITYSNSEAYFRHGTCISHRTSKQNKRNFKTNIESRTHFTRTYRHNIEVKQSNWPHGKLPTETSA